MFAQKQLTQGKIITDILKHVVQIKDDTIRIRLLMGILGNLSVQDREFAVESAGIIDSLLVKKSQSDALTIVPGNTFIVMYLLKNVSACYFT